MNKVCIILIVCFTFWGKSFSQTIRASFELAKKDNKPLLVLEYSEWMVNYPKKYHDETGDSRLDSLLKVKENKEILDNEYILYKMNIDSSNSEEIDFLKKYVPYYTPNYILFNSEGELIHIYSPLFTNPKETNVVASIKDTIAIKNIVLKRRVELSDKIKSDQFTNEELLELIGLYHEVHLNSRQLLNLYANRKLEITPELLKIIQTVDLRTTDEMTTYIFETEHVNDEDWPFFKLGLIQQLTDNAIEEQDKVEFENVKKLKEINSKKQIEKILDIYSSFPIFDKSQSLEQLNERNLEENFNFYSSISDIENIKKYGKLYANFLLKKYEKKKKEFIESQMKSFDWIANNEIFQSDSAKIANENRHKTNRPLLLENELKRYDEYSANALNRISWTYYEKLDNIPDLKKALKWSKQSIKLNSKAALIDTYAHLYYKLGKIKKAIKIEEKALELAQKENSEKYINNFSNELLKFKKKSTY